jgi:ADP-ribose pyrophosphatase YjhB (NUDIX family)
VILLDEADRVLLILFEDAERRSRWWATPGGAMKPRETHEDGAVREIREETGLQLVALGPWVWTREHVFEFAGQVYDQQERFFMARVASFMPQVTGLEAAETAVVRDLRWWTVEELQSADEELIPTRSHSAPTRPPKERPTAHAAEGRSLSHNFAFKSWRGCDGNDPSLDIAKDVEHWF